jgi:hypothetical protein
MSMKQFPIHPHCMRDEKWFPRSIPWEEAEKFRGQALRNHSQTLERLAERGGLSPEEIYAAAYGANYHGGWTVEQHMAALAFVVKLASRRAAQLTASSIPQGESQ